MANEILMPVRYNGNNVGISVVVSNLDTTCNYGRISISLDNHKYEVNFNEEKTDIVTFNNLDQDRSYNIKALLNIDGEDVELSIKTIPSIANENINPDVNIKHLGGCMPASSIRCRVRVD